METIKRAYDTILEFNKAEIRQNELMVLSDVSFSLSRDEFLYIIGKVGSGKTSLIKTINGELPLFEGDANVTGFNLKRIKRRNIPLLRRKLGVVFQDFKLLIDRTVYDNLAFVLKATGWKNKNDINDRIVEVLEKVGLNFKGYKLPHQLSGGEQQRVVIARALLNNPDLILADEPTGNLDPETSIDIIKLLQEISKAGRAVIMATHNYPLIKKFTARTLRCIDGKLTEIDHTKEIDVSTL